MKPLSIFGTKASYLMNIKKNKNALDVACGDGKYSISLAENGWNVSAVDIHSSNFTKNRNYGKIKYFEINLEKNIEEYFYNPPFNNNYNLIIVYKYLYRPLLYKLSNILIKNGILICETFMEGNEKFGRPRNPDYLLKKDELKYLCSNNLEIIDFKQGIRTIQKKKNVMQSAVFRKN